MRTRFVIARAAGLALVVSAAPSFACFDIDAPPTATIRFTSPTTAELIVTGLVVKAGGLTVSDYCAAGLGHSGTLLLQVDCRSDNPPDGMKGGESPRHPSA